MADLPGHSVAITSTRAQRNWSVLTKLETHGKHKCNFKKEFLEMVVQFLEGNIYLLMKLGGQSFRETTIHPLNFLKKDL